LEGGTSLAVTSTAPDFRAVADFADVLFFAIGFLGDESSKALTLAYRRP
jgi:hypothetical protein